jgi:hypothetical protein
MRDHLPPSRRFGSAEGTYAPTGRAGPGGGPSAFVGRRLQAMLAQSPRSALFQAPNPRAAERAPAASRTGLPNALKAGVEALSGFRLDPVRVHYDSEKPAQLGARAYARGSEIYLAPGQERHLPHEAWHLVQQAQGRVKPTLRMQGGMPVCDDPALEREADSMGARALGGGERPLARGNLLASAIPPAPLPVAQLLPADVEERLLAAANQDPALGGAPLVVNAISGSLEQAHVNHRLGGSLAARLQGAGRQPVDLDVEVQNGPDVARAGNAVLAVNGHDFMYRNLQARIEAVRVSFIPDLHAGVQTRFTAQNGERRVVDVDISNENAPQFVGGVRSPEQRGVPPAVGALVTREELVTNYIRRILTFPERARQKGDHLQIAHLLRAAGFDPRNAAHVDRLRQVIVHTFIPENVQLALGVLEAIINEAIRAGLFGPPPPVAAAAAGPFEQ